MRVKSFRGSMPSDPRETFPPLSSRSGYGCEEYIMRHSTGWENDAWQALAFTMRETRLLIDRGGFPDIWDLRWKGTDLTKIAKSMKYMMYIYKRTEGLMSIVHINGSGWEAWETNDILSEIGSTMPSAHVRYKHSLLHIAPTHVTCPHPHADTNRLWNVDWISTASLAYVGWDYKSINYFLSHSHKTIYCSSRYYLVPSRELSCSIKILSHSLKVLSFSLKDKVLPPCLTVSLSQDTILYPQHYHLIPSRCYLVPWLSCSLRILSCSLKILYHFLKILSHSLSILPPSLKVVLFPQVTMLFPQDTIPQDTIPHDTIYLVPSRH